MAALWQSCENVRLAQACGLSGCAVRAVPVANDRVRLGTLLAFYDVELDLIAFLERFVPIQLDRRVVDEYIWPVVTSDESVALGVVEPLDLTFVLSHRLLPSFWLKFPERVDGGKEEFPPPDER